MSYFKLDRGQTVDTSYVIQSLLMAGFVASAAFIGFARAFVPWLGINVFDPISSTFSSLHGYNLIAAEIVTFLILAAILPLAYVFIWRPIAAQLLETRNWLMHSIGFGMTFSGFVTMMTKLFVSDPSVSFGTLSPLAVSIVFASLSLGGMIRLCELNQIEI
ncbi:MAG: hypothetical protein ABJK39_08405 [Hyphomicrobiales bacterium]